jgi:hypothetical protein
VETKQRQIGAIAVAVALGTALVGSALPALGATSLPAGSTATPTATDDRLYPDLIALRASDLRIQTLSDGRRLRFASSLGNKGAGPVEVRPNRNHPCPPGQHNSTQIVYRDANGNGRYNPTVDTSVRRHRAGCMVYHPAHAHWHFNASARYTLAKSGASQDVVVSVRRKVSFCLRDTDRLPAWAGTWKNRQAYGACSRTSRQGISIGWMDIYQSFLAGQFLRLPRNLANGVYCLRIVVDPLDQLVESNNKNNKSVRALRIRGNSVVKADQSRCT